jgi:putative endonuclease
MKTYYVYILTNWNNHVLYTGITNDLPRRLQEHRSGEGSAFTSLYHLTKLVFFESTNSVRAAIAREKQIKGWTRDKKNKLIEVDNPEWNDLGEEFGIIKE